MTTIFIDESGYTGAHLMNPDQPIFALASLQMDEAECCILKDRFFAFIKSTELKHSSLRKYAVQQRAVLAFLEYLSNNHRQRVKIAVADKRFVLTAKIVDMIVEPAVYELGDDLYRRGGNIILSNMLHLFIPRFADQSLLDRLHSTFEALVRDKSAVRLDKFYRITDEDHGSNLINDLLLPLKCAEQVLGITILDHLDAVHLDIALALALVLLSKWRYEISGSITLFHDQTSNMTRQEDIWEKLMDPELPPTEVGYDRRRMKFPIGVHETKFESSRDWVGLQLTDIIAGATMMGAGVYEELMPLDQYGLDAWAILETFDIHCVMPSSRFTPEDLGTNGEDAGNIIDYLQKAIH
jgi:hypothetical protein